MSRATSSTDTCAENPCENGGTCDPKTSGYTCLCPDGYTGRQCVDTSSHDSSPQEVSLSDSPAALIAGICCAVLLIIGLLIVIYFVVKKAKEKRRQHGTYSPSREEQTGRRIELNHVLKPPPIERLI